MYADDVIIYTFAATSDELQMKLQYVLIMCISGTTRTD